MSLTRRSEKIGPPPYFFTSGRDNLAAVSRSESQTALESPRGARGQSGCTWSPLVSPQKAPTTLASTARAVGALRGEKSRLQATSWQIHDVCIRYKSAAGQRAQPPIRSQLRRSTARHCGLEANCGGQDGRPAATMYPRHHGSRNAPRGLPLQPGAPQPRRGMDENKWMEADHAAERG